ncbi:Ionotropic glutamate receptor [Corchorus capsularis]|uniref:Ionotropic glutamate receptor n=1 Tax=Corchorus capsularis TaxID=210143 RepID=A0A1R3GF31_COCAP|nr:Ionotropic glutamate receptor [Corchorus capsularis]
MQQQQMMGVESMIHFIKFWNIAVSVLSEVPNEQHIAWEMSLGGLNTITGPKLSLTFQDLYGNSTSTALSVCDLITNQRVLVIICTLRSQDNEDSQLMTRMGNSVPTPCGEPALSKAKLETVTSVMYMVRHTSGKLSCLFTSLISSINWHKAFEEEDMKSHRGNTDIITLNLTSLATHSSNKVRKLWGVIEMDEASSFLTTSSPLQWIWAEEIGCKGALVGTARAEFRRQESTSRPARKAVLRIGVPVRSNITKFVGVSSDHNRITHITGFSVDVFEAAVRRLPYKITYNLIPFHGSSDELVKNVAHKPFTPGMWLTLVALSLFSGFVIWIIERQDEDGPNLLEALFFLHRVQLRNNASSIVNVLWLFLVLILTQTYTNVLTTELTSSQSEMFNIDSLKRTNAVIGCDGQSQSILYLVKVLGFKRRNIRTIASFDDYENALSTGNIKAAFLLMTYAEVLLAKHCTDFTEIILPYSYNLGGFGFVFPKGSPLASDISVAILELEESGELQLMEEEMPSFSDCSGKLFEDSTTRSIGPSSFIGPFVLMGGTCAIALLITLMRREWEERIQRMLMGRELWLYTFFTLTLELSLCGIEDSALSSDSTLDCGINMEISFKTFLDFCDLNFTATGDLHWSFYLIQKSRFSCFTALGYYWRKGFCEDNIFRNLSCFCTKLPILIEIVNETPSPLQQITLSDSTDGIWRDSGTENAFLGNTMQETLRRFSYHKLVEQIYNKVFDAVVGDATITSDRNQFVLFSDSQRTTEDLRKHKTQYFTADYYYQSEFTDQPHFTMVVHEKPTGVNKFWWFLSPFTRELWLTLLSLTLYTGFVFWIIERQNEQGPSLLEALLFFVQRASPRNSLTYFVLVPWLLVVLVLTATYTSILTSMITSSKTEPSCLLLDNFKTKTARIGCDGDSIIFPYLVEILGFEKENINNISQSSIDDYEKALSSGYIKAAFFSTHYADLFLAKYNKGFTAWEPIPTLHGAAVVFPRGSPQALVKGMSKWKQMLSFSDCSSSAVDGIGPGVFLGGGIELSVLAIHINDVVGLWLCEAENLKSSGRDEVDGRARKAFDKIGKAGQVFCSTTPRPNQMVLMFFQPFHDNISSVELADTMATFCTLTSYEAAIAKGDKSTRKTRAAILCSLSEHSQQVIPETVPLSIYMSQYIYETIEEIVKLISLYQWGTSSSTYKISGLDIITLNLTSHGHPKQSIRIRGQFQMAAILSFSTSLIKHFRSLTEADLFEGQYEDGPNLIEALLFFLQRELPRNRLSYVVKVPWLFLILVLTSTYISSLTSMITSSETEPSCLDMKNLKSRNAIIGCDHEDSIIFPYLVETLGFQRKNIKNISQYSIDEYKMALSSGNIKAAFFSTTSADIFLSKYPKGFTAWEPSTPNLNASSSLVFPRGSSLASNQLSTLSDCSSSTVDGSMKLVRIGPGAFLGLFVLSGFYNCNVNHGHLSNETTLGELHPEILAICNFNRQRTLVVVHNSVFSKPREK